MSKNSVTRTSVKLFLVLCFDLQRGRELFANANANANDHPNGTNFFHHNSFILSATTPGTGNIFNLAPSFALHWATTS